MAVDSQELSKLIPQALAISYWLKENSARAGDLLAVDASNQDFTQVENFIRQLVLGLSVNEGDLTNSQMRYILSQYEAPIWAQALKLIVCRSAQPSLISQEIKRELLDWAYFFQKDGGNDYDELYRELTKFMNKLGHTSFKVLGEFCSLIRDASGSSEKVARDVAPSVFMVPGMNQEQLRAARFLFEQMVQDAERLFGQSAIRTGAVSYGIRSKIEGTQWGLVHTLPEDKKRKQDLRTFYSYIDKKYVGIVDDLFEYHDFTDIALAINMKYGMIPTPWKSDLQRLKQDRPQGLEWFDYESVKTPTPGAGRVPRVNRNMNVLSPAQRTRTDELVDAFIDSEVNFYRRMGALGNFYVKELRAIATGQRSQEEMRNLGLNISDITLLFGDRFQRVMDLSHLLLTNLEVINLLRTKVKVKDGREGILAKVILDLAPQELYQAYSPYSITYPQCAELIKQRLFHRAGHGTGDFVDIWDQVRAHIPTLEQKSIQDILEFPVRRIHSYREILRGLLACTPQHSSAYAALYDAYQAVGRAADSLTAASEQHANASIRNIM